MEKAKKKIKLAHFHYLIISLLTHGVLISFYIISLSSKVKQQSQIAVEIIERKPSIVDQNTKMNRDVKSSQAKSKQRGSNNFSALGGYLPEYSFKSVLLDSNGDTYSMKPWADNPNTEWGSGGRSFERINDFNFYQILYKQVDGSLFYPGVLSRNNVKGTVNARIVFDQGGVCNWQMTKIQGHNAYLELYVLDVLKNVCKMNFKKYLSKRIVTNADLSFQFDMSENNDRERIEKEKVIVGNTLLFYRNSHRSIAEWQLGPFHGIFPVPAIYLNIPWIQENWDSLVNKKDPLLDFKKQFGEG